MCTPSDFSLTGKRIGRGTYGSINLVVHKKSGKQFALKTISKGDINNSVLAADVYREIEVHQRLRHPSIIKLYTHFEDKQNLYLVLEYAANGSLFHHLRKRRDPLPEAEARTLYTQICEGIAYLHSQTMIHRDLKPENVVLDANRRVKIIDFGWCIQTMENRQTVCGTIDFMAPEIFEGRGYSFEVDLWALGILLYEMLHKKVPFSSKLPLQSVPPYSIRPDLSADVRDLLTRLIRRAPSERLRIDQVLQHPWLRQDQPRNEQPSQEERVLGFLEKVCSDPAPRMRVFGHSDNTKSTIASQSESLEKPIVHKRPPRSRYSYQKQLEALGVDLSIDLSKRRTNAGSAGPVQKPGKMRAFLAVLGLRST